MGKKSKKSFKKFNNDTAREMDAKKSLSPSSKPNTSKDKSKNDSKMAVQSSAHLSEPNIPSGGVKVEHFDSEPSTDHFNMSENSESNLQDMLPAEQPVVTPGSEEQHFRQLSMNEGIVADNHQSPKFEEAEVAQQSPSYNHVHQTSRQNHHGVSGNYSKPKPNWGYSDNHSNRPAKQHNQFPGSRSFYNNDRKQSSIDRGSNRGSSEWNQPQEKIQNRDDRPNLRNTEQYQLSQVTNEQYQQPHEKGRRNSFEKRDRQFFNKNRTQKDGEHKLYKDGGSNKYSNENRDGYHDQQSNDHKPYNHDRNNQHFNKNRPYKGRRYDQTSNEDKHFKKDGQGSRYQQNDRNRNCWAPPEIHHDVINDGDNWDEPQKEVNQQVTVEQQQHSWSEEVESTLQDQNQPGHNVNDWVDTNIQEEGKDTETIGYDHQTYQTERSDEAENAGFQQQNYQSTSFSSKVMSYGDEDKSTHVTADWEDNTNLPASENQAADYKDNYQDQRTYKQGGSSAWGDSHSNTNWRDKSNEGLNISTQSEGANWRNSRQKDPRMDRRSLDLFDTRYEKEDKEYKEFVMGERSGKEVHYKKLVEQEKDLFDMPKEYSFAHCVAEDMKMGSGIAVAFKREFKEVDSLLNQRTKQGGLALLELNGGKDPRYIYYLVTKRQSTGKPTYLTFWSSLQKMRDHIKNNGVKKLAIPRLGCGLDRLDWPKVKHMIEFLFKDVDVEIVVCSLIQTSTKSETKDKKLKAKQTKQPPVSNKQKNKKHRK